MPTCWSSSRRWGTTLPAADPRVSRAAEAQEHLRGRAAGAGQRAHRPDPHQLQSDRCRHRPLSVSSEPNLQNIPVRTPRGRGDPARVRAAARAGSSWWRTTPRSSCGSWRTSPGDPAFIEAFHQGGDIHRQTAALIFGVPVEQVTSEMRARAKTINFATIYGQGPFALCRQLGISQEDAKAFIARYFERFAGVRAFLDRQVKLAREQGYVETLFKRRRYIPEIRDRNFNIRAYGERTAQNSPLQGTRGRSHQARDDPHPRRDPGGGAGEPDAAAGARRAGLRGAARRAGRHARAGADPHGEARRSWPCRWWWISASAPTGWRPSGDRPVPLRQPARRRLRASRRRRGAGCPRGGGGDAWRPRSSMPPGRAGSRSAATRRSGPRGPSGPAICPRAPAAPRCRRSRPTSRTSRRSGGRPGRW